MNTEISRYLVDANGNSFSSDTDLQSLSKNAKVKNTNSGVSYKKVQGTSVPVFDKVPFQEGQPDAVLYSPQSLTSAQKQQARTNIGASSHDAVLYDTDQQLTEAQKQRARTNIGALGSVSSPISFGGGTITHGESYTEIKFALGPDYPGSALFHWFIVRIGSIALDGVNGLASVRWDNPLSEHSYMDNATVQVTPSRGSNDGGRWGDDYFCLFTQNITKEGFDIYSNHLGDAGSNGRVDYIFTALNTTQS